MKLMQNFNWQLNKLENPLQTMKICFDKNWDTTKENSWNFQKKAHAANINNQQTTKAKSFMSMIVIKCVMLYSINGNQVPTIKMKIQFCKIVVNAMNLSHLMRVFPALFLDEKFVSCDSNAHQVYFKDMQIVNSFFCSRHGIICAHRLVSLFSLNSV